MNNNSIPLKCPGCGANLEVSSDVTKYFTCKYCGLTSVVRDAIVQNYMSTININISSMQDFEVKGGKLVKYNGDNVTVRIPDNVRVIGKLAFRELAVEAVYIPDTVVEIEEGAFMYCNYLREIRLPNLERISNHTFAYCKNLREIQFPNNLKTIDINAFYGCDSLQKVSFNEGLEAINEGAFSYCMNLAEIILPKSLKRIEDLAFAGSSKLTSVKFMGDVKNISFNYLNNDNKGAILCAQHFLKTPFELELRRKWKKEHCCLYCGGKYRLLSLTCSYCFRSRNEKLYNSVLI